MNNSKSLAKNANLITKLLTTLEQRSSSNSNEEDDDDDESDNEDEEAGDGDEDGDKTLRGKSKAELEPTITQEEIDDIWADKSPEYMAATPTYMRQKFAKNIVNFSVGSGQDESDTIIGFATPIGVNDRLMAGLQVVLNETTIANSDNNSSTDSFTDINGERRYNRDTDTPATAYAKLKQNPIFNPDMSLNLNELAKLSISPNPGPSTTNYSWTTTRESPTPDRDLKRSPSPMSSASTPLSTSPLSRANSYSLSHSQQTTSNCKCAPRSCYSEHNQNLNQNLNQNFILNPNHDNHTTSDPFTKSRYLPQFSRSAVGGSKFLTNCHPYNPEEYDGLEFESRFESGNLAKAVQITPTYYELYLRPDLYTSRSRQWFYFRVRKTKRNMLYR